jgi:hypothetical protein
LLIHAPEKPFDTAEVIPNSSNQRDHSV